MIGDEMDNMQSHPATFPAALPANWSSLFSNPTFVQPTTHTSTHPRTQVSRCCGLKITSEGYVVTLAKNNHHVLVLNTLYIH